MTSMETIRDRQTAATRAAIVDAFLDLAHSENAVSISMPAVATRAGVSVRTLYRYFPNKSELQTEAALHYSRRADAALATTADGALGSTAHLQAMWRDFATQLPAVIAEHTAPAGRELRATRLPISRESVRKVAPTIANDPERVDLVIAVTSSSMFLELVGRMGYAPDHAAKLAITLAKLIVDDAAPKETRS